MPIAQCEQQSVQLLQLAIKPQRLQLHIVQTIKWPIHEVFTNAEWGHSSTGLGNSTLTTELKTHTCTCTVVMVVQG